MKSLWSAADRDELRSRIRRLDANARPVWGRMTCSQMVAHLNDALALYAGELSAAAKRTPLRYAPLKQVVVYLIPIPKNVPTAPELITRTPGPWNDEVSRLERRVDDFYAQRTRTDWPLHPILGRLSRRALGVLAYKHTDHHLRQFGV